MSDPRREAASAELLALWRESVEAGPHEPPEVLTERMGEWAAKHGLTLRIVHPAPGVTRYVIEEWELV